MEFPRRRIQKLCKGTEFTVLSASVMPGYIQECAYACRRQPERKIKTFILGKS